ncbi:MAG TPA: VOC family protein [Nitrolancea sp.]|nr:VOC family protein [Nitrolancea sp.]
MMQSSKVRELRVVLTVDDYHKAVRFYRDVLGLRLLEAFDLQPGEGAILDAGRATLEIISQDHADFVDEIEVGKRVPSAARLAFHVDDSTSTADALVMAGAERLSDPVTTPWKHRNVRLRAPDGMQLTLFTVLDPEPQT